MDLKIILKPTKRESIPIRSSNTFHWKAHFPPSSTVCTWERCDSVKFKKRALKVEWNHLPSKCHQRDARLSFILTLLKIFSFSCVSVLEGLTMYSFKECTLLRLFSHPEGLLSDAFIWARKRTQGTDVVVQTGWHRDTFSLFFVYAKDFSESTVHVWNRIFEEAAREREKSVVTSLRWTHPKMENVFRLPPAPVMALRLKRSGWSRGFENLERTWMEKDGSGSSTSPKSETERSCVFSFPCWRFWPRRNTSAPRHTFPA